MLRYVSFRRLKTYFFTQIYYVETKEHEFICRDRVGGKDIDKRIAFVVDVSGRESQHKLSITTFYYLYLNARTRQEKEKNGIIARHGWAAEQND